MEGFDTSSIKNWLIGVVVVGIVINLISSFLFKGAEPLVWKMWSKISSRSEQRRQEKKQERSAQILHLIGNEKEQLIFMFAEMRKRQSSIYFKISSVGSSITGFIFLLNVQNTIFSATAFIAFFLMGFFAEWQSIAYWRQSNEMSEILAVVRNSELNTKT